MKVRELLDELESAHYTGDEEVLGEYPDLGIGGWKQTSRVQIYTEDKRCVIIVDEC